MPVIFRIRREYERLWEQENQRAPGGGHERDRAGRGHDRELAPAHRREHRAQGDAEHARGPGHPRRDRRARRATRSSTPRSETDWSSCARTWRPPSPDGRPPTRPHDKPPTDRPKHLQGAFRNSHADQPRRDNQHPQEPHRGARRRRGRADRGRHGPVGGRRHRAPARPGELHVASRCSSCPTASPASR